MYEQLKTGKKFTGCTHIAKNTLIFFQTHNFGLDVDKYLVSSNNLRKIGFNVHGARENVNDCHSIPFLYLPLYNWRAKVV